MRTVTFKSVMTSVAVALGLDPTRTFDNALAAQVTDFINNRVEAAWKWGWWSEWTLTEQRQYRANYASATAYLAPTVTAAVEVFFQASGKYYQTLQGTTGNAPATLTGGQYVVNGEFWAECANSYSGNDWATGTVYARGDVVRNLDNGRFYQCHTAHTAGGSFDDTKFGVLTPFNPLIALDQSGQTAIGEVKQVTRRDPRVFPENPYNVPFAFSYQGLQITTVSPPAQVWVQFRTAAPRFQFSTWSATTAYAAGDIVYHAATGECYMALQAGTNQNPSTETAYWRRIEFPAVLANHVKRIVLADCLRMSKQNSRAAREEELADDELEAAFTRDQEQQRQYKTASVETYGS